MTLEERCAFLERELFEVGIQLDAAQKRLRLAYELAKAVRTWRENDDRYVWMVDKAMHEWNKVPGDELHDTEGPMIKHTPGPWAVSDVGEVVVCATGRTLCDVYSPPATGEEQADVDAHLIAAAPDLLAVLEELLPDLQCRCDIAFTSRERHEPNTLCHHEDGVKAAIAKARGK
jgi:hypothetical protein